MGGTTRAPNLDDAFAEKLGNNVRSQLADAFVAKTVKTQQSSFGVPMDLVDENLLYVQRTVQLMYLLVRTGIIQKTADQGKIDPCFDINHKLQTTFMLQFHHFIIQLQHRLKVCTILMLQISAEKNLQAYLIKKKDEFALIQLKHLLEDVLLANTRGNDTSDAKA
jgi:hypothetical protein